MDCRDGDDISDSCRNAPRLHSAPVGEAEAPPATTRFEVNIIGGLVFGVGFALIAYCPGTGAAAFGQGNWDALFCILGLMTGSYFYAELSECLDRFVKTLANKGKLILHDLLYLPRSAVALGMAGLFAAVLRVLEYFYRTVKHSVEMNPSSKRVKRRDLRALCASGAERASMRVNLLRMEFSSAS